MSQFILGLAALLTPVVFLTTLFILVSFERIDKFWSGKRAIFYFAILFVLVYLSIPMYWYMTGKVSLIFRILYFPIQLCYLFFGLWITGISDKKFNPTTQKNISIIGMVLLTLDLAIGSVSCLGPFFGAMLQEGPEDKFWQYLFGLMTFAFAVLLPVIILILIFLKYYSTWRSRMWWHVIRISVGIIMVLSSMFGLVQHFP